jgi:hypothetical protein
VTDMGTGKYGLFIFLRLLVCVLCNFYTAAILVLTKEILRNGIYKTVCTNPLTLRSTEQVEKGKVYLVIT